MSTLASVRQTLGQLRLARRRQLAGRVLRPVKRRRVPRPTGSASLRSVEAAAELWRSPAFAKTDAAAAGLERGELDVLGRTIQYPRWDDEGLESLRAFHLHYGDEALGAARLGGAKLDAARAGIADWIRANPPPRRPAWHPYPLATRIANWVAATTLEPSLATPDVAASLARQLAYLERNVEEEILGNHVIRNAAALVLGGKALGDGALADRGLALLARELPEQVLDDGGHYERSPVYHAVVLRDLLQVEAAAPEAGLARTTARMLEALAVVTRPDGMPALFNDGALDLAPDLRHLLPAVRDGLAVLPSTGYAVLRSGRVQLAFRCGRAAPDFLPPHAHADALSFQLWVDGQPVVVDPGTSTYEPGPERDRERGTPAHATVSLDGASQFELAGAFRAVGIPDVEIVEAGGDERAGAVAAELVAFGRVRHRRRIAWSEGRIEVEDTLDGRGRRRVESALPLAPGTDVDEGPSLRAGPVTVAPVGDLAVVVEERTAAERLFRPKPAPALVGRAELVLPARFGWSIALA